MAAVLILAAVFHLAPSSAATSGPGPSVGEIWPGADAATGQITDPSRLEHLAERFPDSASVRLRLLNALLESEDLDAAVSVISGLYERGYRLSPHSEEQVLALTERERRERLASLFGEESLAIAAASGFTTIPTEALLVESLAYDPGAGVLYATTVVSRTLYAADGDGAWHPVPIESAACLSGIVRDPASGIIWLASGDPGLGSEPVPGFRGLIGFDPAAGRVVRRVTAPANANPSDLAIGPDGTLYVSDPLAGVVYRAVPGSERLEPLAGPGTFRSPQGLAVGQGGRLLYVSDYRYGLAYIDLADGTAYRLGGKDALFLDGIDGLWRDGDALVAVQNGTRPMRILRLDLRRDGTAIAAEQVLEQASPAWTEPLGGTIVDGQLLYVANGQWDRFVEGGDADPDNPPEATRIHALPLRAPAP